MTSPRTGPELPPREAPVESVSALYVSRQKDACSASYMNESGEWFCQDLNRPVEINKRLEALSIDETNQKMLYWKNLILLWSVEPPLSPQKVNELENHIVNGIPSELRPLVYLKVLQIRQKLANKHPFESLVKSARSKWGGSQFFIDRLDVDVDMKDVLTVVHSHINSSEYTNTHSGAARYSSQPIPRGEADPAFELLPNSFVMHTAKFVSLLPDTNSEERFYIMLKLNKMFEMLDKDALCYQINRSIEDTLPEFLKHLTTQGADLSTLYTKILYTFCSEFVKEDALLMTLLDFMVFEGLDFFLRFIVNAFLCKQKEISALSGGELVDYVSLPQLFEGCIVWETVLNMQPHVIKYENEYHLIHANSFNKNDNELRNLREINHDLTIRAYEDEQQLNILLQSHGEIEQQKKDLSQKLHEALEKQRTLAREKEILRLQHDVLTMKENVINTTKANEVFAQRNEELAQILLAARERVATKKAKFEKSRVPSPS